MILKSNRETIRSQTVSAFAIFETIVAGTICVFWYYRFDTLVHVVISAAIAPFLLVQTPRSIDRNLTLADFAHHIRLRMLRFSPMKPSQLSLLPMTVRAIWGFFRVLISLLLSILMMFVAKIVGFVVSLLSHPIESFGYVPENWRKIVLCTDIFTAPEFIPGINEIGPEDRRSSLRAFSIEKWVEITYTKK